jgi:hypothetical protein
MRESLKGQARNPILQGYDSLRVGTQEATGQN